MGTRGTHYSIFQYSIIQSSRCEPHLRRIQCAILRLLAVISNDSAIFSMPSSLCVIIGSMLILFCAIKRAASTICFGVASSGGNR